jgi:hypothetical protein
MTKRLAALDRIDRESALRLPPRHRTHRLGSFLVALLLAAGATGVVLVARHDSRHPNRTAITNSGQHFGLGSDSASSTTAKGASGAKDVPPPGVGEQSSRLLPAVKGPAGNGGYQLINVSSGAPPRYDPCRPIHYVIRDQDTPTGGDELVRQAVAAVSKATGLKFVEDATTTETPNQKRAPYQPSRYGKRWAPVLIAWTNPTEVPSLKGNVAGWGGSIAFSEGTSSFGYVSGYAYLDTAQLKAMQSPAGNAVAVRAVIEHELGHVVGLAHVSDPRQLMYPQTKGQTGYGAGDFRGLAIAGGGACQPEL